MYTGRHLASTMRTCANNAAGKNSTNEKIRNNDSAPTKTSYTVLYYKRKNKVHKSKGVSKLDGTLTVVAGSSSSLSVTLQSADTGAIVYRGGLRSNGNSSNETFEIDETIQVGAYEVEILSCDDNADAHDFIINGQYGSGTSSVVSAFESTGVTWIWLF